MVVEGEVIVFKFGYNRVLIIDNCQQKRYFYKRDDTFKHAYLNDGNLFQIELL